MTEPQPQNPNSAHPQASQSGGELAGRAARKQQLAENLSAVQDRIARAGGADLLPITKFHPASDIELLNELGVGEVGENREQEARAKHAELGARVAFHMVGQIQTKKANAVARWAAMVHTVDSAKLAHALDRGVALALERGERSTPLPVLVQYSADGDPARGGAVAEAIPELADIIGHSEHLVLRGLMTVPPLGAEPTAVFAQGRRLLDRIGDRISGPAVYSAGMSHDLDLAIAEGATLVRVGTDIVGPRPVL